jgi:hypothetical protein
VIDDPTPLIDDQRHVIGNHGLQYPRCGMLDSAQIT